MESDVEQFYYYWYIFAVMLVSMERPNMEERNQEAESFGDRGGGGRSSRVVCRHYNTEKAGIPNDTITHLRVENTIVLLEN
eukprot:scaffold14152_cov79-Cylindrotheca_fusiformis.AAC.1